MIDLRNKPEITGEKTILRPFRAEDFEDMEECLKDPEVIKLTGSDSDYNRELTMNWYATRNEQKNRLDLAIQEKSTGAVIGEVVINEYDPVMHSMNFRILIGPKGRDKGLGSEATQQIIDYVFEHTDLKQLTLGVYAFNPRAQRVYEKTGFVVESVDEGELVYEGQLIDSINMVLTREVWRS